MFELAFPDWAVLPGEGPAGSDLVFNIHAATTPHQAVSGESLSISQPAVVPQVATDPSRTAPHAKVNP